MASQLIPPNAAAHYPLPSREHLAAAIETLLAVMDAIDGDAEAEDGDEDCCLAGDDGVFSGPIMGGGNYRRDPGPGDPQDEEANGDERDGNCSEDDFMSHADNGPGCPISDPGGCEHDGREELR